MTRRVIVPLLLSLVASMAVVVVRPPGASAETGATGFRLVFVHLGDIWISDPSGSQKVNLTTTTAVSESEPTLSHSGRYVAYKVGAATWVMDLATRSRRELPAAAGGAVDFSPTDDTLAFGRYTSGVFDLFTVGLDGTGLRNWTNDVAVDGHINITPQWSADGRSLLFVRAQGARMCRQAMGGFDDLHYALRLHRLTAGRTSTEVAGSDDVAVSGGHEGGGTLAYVRSSLPPTNESGYCATDPDGRAEIVIDGAASGPAWGAAPSVNADGDVAYTNAGSVMIDPAGPSGPRVAFEGHAPDWGVAYAAPDPGTDASPVARCDVYWVKPGARLTVPASRGLLRNDSDPGGAQLRPRITQISFGRSTHPFSVSKTGAIRLRTTKADRRLMLVYVAVNADGLTSEEAVVTVLVSRRKPSAAELEPCSESGPDRVLRGANAALATAVPPPTRTHMKILRGVIKSNAYWKRVLKQRRSSPFRAMDFSQDGCSAPGVVKRITEFNFTPACVRHDFGYRNALWMGVFNDKKRSIDDAFKEQMFAICAKFEGSRGTKCRNQARAYATAVRKAGGRSVPARYESWNGAAKVRINTVFQPVDNFYIRGILTDTSSDGRSVRLQMSPAQTGRNPSYVTVARSEKGAGKDQYFDYSFTGWQNLKGAFFQLCVDSDRPDAEECGDRFYIDKP